MTIGKVVFIFVWCAIGAVLRRYYVPSEWWYFLGLAVGVLGQRAIDAWDSKDE